MSKKSLRYVEVQIKGESFTFSIKRVQYRDAKGRLSKFTKRKKLSMEVIGERLVTDKKTSRKVLHPHKIKKYSTPLKYRKHAVSPLTIEKRIRTRLMREKKSILETTVDGVVKFTYVYTKRKKGSRRYRKVNKVILVKKKISHNGKRKKGSRNGNKKSQKT